ncbi:MAG: 4Fe-4S dicluster domain-containing protein [Caldilineaceae bacterium SB0670_bin_27]|uniref:4Fe-4S dicluster domain-containing protein n=1 Tax=Caldilineaceae bacterium SB0664_bin_27 TaxID=2605260 RepID=A0A6B0Z391_9CHLR|nr:4Fe-4S dicluster domain-containing protein [Caldilineaceae bacterium SB0664_bin_27]MYJ77434.1 4Fe-4S dicluster domain-containing protein [Caldilineaceae bacterium SB0670_bin_27]
MFGTGLLKGLGVTLKHALDTFEDDRDSVPDRYRGSLDLGNNRRVIQQPIDQEGLLTIQYPEEKRLLPERFRYIPMLIWDSEKQEDRCTACGICAKVCPPQCIWIVRDSDENGKPVTRCSEFYIDAAVCMSCSFCVEFCPFDAIKMNHDYELAVYDRYPQLVYDMEELTVPLEYYAALWPTQYEEEQARRKEEEEQKRKQEEEKAAKAAARAAAKSAAAATDSAAAQAAPKRSAAELQALAKERAAQRQAQAADAGGSDDDAAAAKKARMEELKRRAQERARQRKEENGQ